jgi:lipopolysaccharide export LptBFGC system permease protein LptF
MSLLDRYIVGRFLSNFAILFALLFVFAVAIDLLLQLDRFVDVVQARTPEAGPLWRAVVLAGVVLDFHGPRIFQFYAYMLGLLSIGAMGFTLAQMHRHRELVAVLASGVRLHRVAAPLVCAVFGLNLLQLLNQEFVLPKLAPLLIRKHGDIGQASVGAFEVLLTADGDGNLLQAPTFDPQTNTLSQPTILVRDETGRTARRITADAATWDEPASGWRLTQGFVMTPRPNALPEPSAQFVRQPIELFETDLSPDVLNMRQYRQFAAMLSTKQIKKLLNSGQPEDRDVLVRFRYSRFTTVLINMLLLVITLPFFLLREPANLLRQSLLCAGIAIPAMLGALIGLTMDLPGIASIVEVFLPGLVLIPIAMFQVTLIRT